MTNEPYLVTTDQDKDAVTALHSMCGWSPYEQTKLQTVLDDQNCFTMQSVKYNIIIIILVFYNSIIIFQQ